jgi:hypothetical protein
MPPHSKTPKFNHLKVTSQFNGGERWRGRESAPAKIRIREREGGQKDVSQV